jgi:hypothetical protein
MSKQEPLSWYNSRQARSGSDLRPAAFCWFFSCSQWWPSSNCVASVSSSQAARRRAMGEPQSPARDTRLDASGCTGTRRVIHSEGAQGRPLAAQWLEGVTVLQPSTSESSAPAPCYT